MTESSADNAQSHKEHDITMILGSQLEIQPCICNAIKLGRKGCPQDPQRSPLSQNEGQKLRLPSTPEHLRHIFSTPELI